MRDGSRARELLPTVLLTLLSVVQALALEAAWSSVKEMTFLYEGGVLAWQGWMQVAAVFQGIIVIWLFYISMVMRFSWVPTTWDSLAPFVLGAGELAMIQLMEARQVAYWFYVLAAMFAFSTWVSNRMFAAGIRDPLNAELAQTAPRSGSLVQMIPWAFVAVLGAMGLLVQWVGAGGAVALTCLVAANLLLLAQAWQIQHFWRNWVGEPASTQ